MTIGRHGVITTEQARKKASPLREGIDPNKVKKQARAKQLTLAEAAEIYLDAPKVRAPATLAEYRATLQRYFRDWLARPLSEITRKDCYGRHRKIGKERGTYAANGAMRMIRATYNRALKQFEDLPPVNPVIAVDWYPEEARDAAIAAEDLAEWYQGIHRLPNPIRTDYYLFVLLSGLRRRSAAVMRWEHVDLRAGTLFIPEPKGGKKRAFSLPLSDMMVDVLAKRREQNVIFYGADNPWGWPAASRPGHMVEPKLSDNDEKLVKVPFTICITVTGRKPDLHVKAVVEIMAGFWKSATGSDITQAFDKHNEPTSPAAHFICGVMEYCAGESVRYLRSSIETQMKKYIAALPEDVKRSAREARAAKNQEKRDAGKAKKKALRDAERAGLKGLATPC
ncbi:hypothetical protein WV31_18010 [Magnetospirillum sp. ME-1]|nr:hypothetical protein WV31_18010 [Magnetospirillum sp. ME-1]